MVWSHLYGWRKATCSRPELLMVCWVLGAPTPSDWPWGRSQVDYGYAVGLLQAALLSGPALSVLSPWRWNWASRLVDSSLPCCCSAYLLRLFFSSLSYPLSHLLPPLHPSPLLLFLLPPFHLFLSLRPHHYRWRPSSWQQCWHLWSAQRVLRSDERRRRTDWRSVLWWAKRSWGRRR